MPYSSPCPPQRPGALLVSLAPSCPCRFHFPPAHSLSAPCFVAEFRAFTFFLHKGWPSYQVFHLLPHNCPLLGLFLVNMSNARVLVRPCQVCHAVEQSWVCIRIPGGMHYNTNPKSCPWDSDPVRLKVGHGIRSFTQLLRYSPELEKD